MKASHIKKQYTPVYNRLWNRDFTILIVAELLLCISCYTSVPFLAYRLYANDTTSLHTAIIMMAAFVAGIFLSGFFCNWTIQRYRRNKAFCLSSICLAGIIALMPYIEKNGISVFNNYKQELLTATCLVCGMLFGNAKRVLSCTLLIDKTESSHRTEANYTAIWIARMAVVASPICYVFIHQQTADIVHFWAAAAGMIIATILVMSIKFPFRAPEEGVRLLSFDRFLLTGAWNVALVVLFISASLGLLLSAKVNVEFSISVLAGLIISIVMLQYTVVRNGRHTSTIGNICILVAIAAISLHNGPLENSLKPMLLGLGYGLVSSEQLYKLLEQCNHCQRSTAESTYFTASDCGIFLGIAVGFALADTTIRAEYIAMTLFGITALICAANATVKKRHGGYHA